MIADQVFQYPRRIRWSIELFCAVVVTLAALRFGRDLLLLLWARQGLDGALFSRVPVLASVVRALQTSTGDPASYSSLASLLPALGWFALALLLALLLRNSLPTVRTSARGLLVEFAGEWLPISWEHVRAIKVTEDASAQRFVLLAETDRKQLTGWHRVYSLVYGLRFGRAFLITSWIGNFDRLIKTLLAETDRVARVLDAVKPAQLNEEASSVFFRFVLGPGSFFSQRTAAEAPPAPSPAPVAAPAAPAASAAASDGVHATYPARIRSVLLWSGRVLLVLALLRYILTWMTFLAVMFPRLQTAPLFDRLRLLQGQLAAPWWVLIAGHLALFAVLAVVALLWNLLPNLQARAEGLAVQRGTRWHVVPWARVRALKVTELSEQSQAILVQTRSGLPFMSRFSSLLYNGSFVPGVLLTSALGTFESFMQSVVLHVTTNQNGEDTDQPPILQDEARSPLLILSVNAGAAIDRFVADSRDDGRTKLFDAHQLARAARPMLVLALAPTLIVFASRAIQQALVPDGRLLVGMLFLFVLSMLEWPIVCLAAQMIDEATGGGEEGARPFYLYPLIQLPRVLLMLAALLVTLLGIPYIAVLLWIGAIVWSFLLAAGLWEALYDWSGGLLLAGGLLPAVFQLLILLGYLIAL